MQSFVKLVRQGIFPTPHNISQSHIERHQEVYFATDYTLVDHQISSCRISQAQGVVPSRNQHLLESIDTRLSGRFEAVQVPDHDLHKLIGRGGMGRWSLLLLLTE
jgi:hypothetical protein